MINFNISLSTSFAIPTELMQLVHRIDESKALAIYQILGDNGTETFNIYSMQIFAQDEGVATPVQGKRLFRVAADSRGGALLPPISSAPSPGLLLQNGPNNRLQPMAPLIITSPRHQVRFISTATETLNLTVIYDWVVHPFSAIIKAMLLGELLGEVRQVQVQRSAGGEYFQPARIVQIGGIPPE